MPPHKQLILLDEVALNEALRRKGSQRPEDDGDEVLSLSRSNNPAPIPISSPVRRSTYLMEPETIRKRQRGAGPLLLDENGLQRALKAKAEKRKVAQESADRRKLALSSMDRMIDSFSGVPATSEKYPKVFIENKMAFNKNQRKPDETSSTGIPKDTMSTKRSSISELYPAKPVSPNRVQKKVVSKPPLASASSVRSVSSKKATSSQPKPKGAAPVRNSSQLDSSSVASSIHMDESNRSATRKVIIKKKSARKVKKTRADGSASTAKGDVATQIPLVPLEDVVASLPVWTGKKTPSSRKIDQSSPAAALESNEGNAPPAAALESNEGNAPPPAPLIRMTKKTPAAGSSRKGEEGLSKRPPSKLRIVKEFTAKRSSDSVSTLEDPSVVSNVSDQFELEPTSNHSIVNPTSNHNSQSMSFRKQKPFSWTSNNTQQLSFRKQQPYSWSIRNEVHTGFAPNEYITKETMTDFTENLGGVETVKTTTKVFFDKAKNDPELKGFFQTTKWEHVRNEFIILANLEVPQSFDERIKGVLEHHCKFLENGADMERLVTIWESAIESTWLDHQMDDARQLIVGPSRVIFNLRALERHYAMHLKAVRAASRESKKEVKSNDSTASSRSGGILGRLRRRGQ